MRKVEQLGFALLFGHANRLPTIAQTEARIHEMGVSNSGIQAQRNLAPNYPR